MITLKRKDNNESLTLPNHFRFQDEHDWRAIAQTEGEYTLSGAYVLQQGRKLAGRPVTLGNDENSNWLDFARLETLMSWADVPELVMTLNYHGRTFDVCFAAKALTANPVLWQHDNPRPNYHLTLYFLTV